MTEKGLNAVGAGPRARPDSGQGIPGGHGGPPLRLEELAEVLVGSFRRRRGARQFQAQEAPLPQMSLRPKAENCGRRQLITEYHELTAI
jgi:hypothetical protein